VTALEWWQRGPVADVPPVLQPVAHIVLQVRDEVHALVADLPTGAWDARPADAASVTFHLRHIVGVLDRLFTYARGEALTETQFVALRAEAAPLAQDEAPALLAALDTRVDECLAQLSTTDAASVTTFRAVGRAQLPSSVLGCLVHGAEHAMRHVGQLSVTVRVVRAAHN
jgi:uncharacterized damage-inducible protein DinB